MLSFGNCFVNLCAAIGNGKKVMRLNIKKWLSKYVRVLLKQSHISTYNSNKRVGVGAGEGFSNNISLRV